MRIIDLVIDCDTNPWPARTTGSYSVARPSASKNEIETWAKSRLVDQFNAVTAQGLKDWLCGEVNERNAALSVDPQHPKSTRPIHMYHGVNGQLAAYTIRCLTIKIRYGTAFYLKKDSHYDSNGFGTGHFLDELVFQIYRKSGVPTLNGLTIECVKTKVRQAPHVTQASSSPTDGMDMDLLFPEIGV